jgi:hypothetical protein
VAEERTIVQVSAAGVASSRFAQASEFKLQGGAGEEMLVKTFAFSWERIILIAREAIQLALPRIDPIVTRPGNPQPRSR